MFFFSGAWIFGLFLAIPLVMGVATTGKRWYRFLRSRGVDSEQATTTAVISMILLVGVMSSPWMLPFTPLRVAVSLVYLYFLYVGAGRIVAFFTGNTAEDREAQRTSHNSNSGSAGNGSSKPDAHRAQKRDPSDIRKELDRRRND